MIKRGLALSLVLGFATIARADAIVEFAASASGNPYNPCGFYDTGETVSVDVFVTQTGGAEHLLRLVQLNLTGGDMTTSAVAWDAGAGHYLDTGAATGPPGIATAFYFTNPAEFGPNDAQLVMPAGGSVKVATIDVVMPGVAGAQTLDVLNAGEADTALHGRVNYGFGCDPGDCDGNLHADATEPVTFLEAGIGLTGGTMVFNVIDQALAVATPDDQRRLWRSAKHVIRLAFDTDLTNVPVAGEIDIRTMIAGGTFGATDLSVNFAFSIENDGGGDPRILRMEETTIPSTMTHRSWYSIRNLGWGDVAAFEVQNLLQIGDADDNGFTTPVDVSAVNSNIGPAFADDLRFDIDGNKFVTPVDVTLTNANISGFVLKPFGHECQ